ncbi:MAG: hypothetical protein D3903_12945 [Candidatus Electrothrix sp. GM3_4]|nr:hypothetical protein [Candidatus Electrothrix sp. GM3_4]
MPNYIVNKNAQDNGDHEVHDNSAGCLHMPSIKNQLYLGFHLLCNGAVIEAKKKLPGERVNGCYYCCNPCHTR